MLVTESCTNRQHRQANIELHGRLAVLRPVAESDLPLLQRWDEDSVIMSLMGRRYAEMGEARPHRSAKPDRATRSWMIETTDRRVIGELGLVQINWRVSSAEIQVCIGEKDCWGHGYGTDALQTLLAWSFDTFGLGTIYLRVFTSNTRAVRLYERLGFRKEGVLAASARRQDPSAVLLMSMTQERWGWIIARGGATAQCVG